MNRKELTAAVKQLAYELGADMVGIAPVSRFDGQPHMLRPTAHLPEAKSVICFGVHHPDASVEWCGEPNPNFPEAFQIGMIPKLDTMCYRVAAFLEKEGYPTVAQPCTTYWRHRKYKDVPYEHAATFSHMAAFVACGLGEYGYHGMVMSPEYGPRERIISIITSADLEPDPLYQGPALCDQCKMCAKHCIGKNYTEDKLNDPKYIEFEIEGKKFSYPNINRWRCFYGEQAHLDTTYLEDLTEMDEEKIYEAIKTVPRVDNHGYMCRSFKFCMTKEKRVWDKKYSPGPRRKKELSTLSKEEIVNRLIELAKASGADRMHIAPLSDFEALKPNFDKGFRTEQFFEEFTTVITFGRNIYDYTSNVPLGSRGGVDLDFGHLLRDEKNMKDLLFRNGLHVERPATDRITAGLLDVTRYLDDLGYNAIQDWTLTGISDQSATNAGWNVDGKKTFAVSVICNLPLERDNRIIREWKEECFPKIDSESPLFKHVEMVSVGKIDGITYPGIEKIKEIYPNAKSIVALACEIPERTVELACNQEAEDGGAYAYMHYEILKECIWAGVDLCDALEDKGYFAVTLADLDPDSYLTIGKLGRHMPDLAANAPFAAAAGLGGIGKSGMLVHPECGPRLRYAFVITDADLEATEHAPVSLCAEGCTACAESCPMKALDPAKLQIVSVRENESYPVMVRDETRCMWSRSLAMCEGAGSDQLGWKLPDIPVPEEITEEKIQEVLDARDPIQVLCYQCPNFTDIIIERCLQKCPIAKKLNK